METKKLPKGYYIKQLYELLTKRTDDAAALDVAEKIGMF
jgi:hypothetical protein